MRNFLNKLLLCIITFLLIGIVCKKNDNLKQKIKYELYENHLSFTRIKELYNHYLGGIIPLEKIKIKKDISVFKEKINYQEITPYLNGAKLKVTNNYLVPNQESGVVVFIGEKDEYGKVIIIEGKENVDKWYGNICNTNLKLYDYIEENKYIGETCDENLYLVFSKDNKFLNYEEYIS